MDDKSLFQEFSVKQSPKLVTAQKANMGTTDFPKRIKLKPYKPKKKYKLLDRGLISEDIANKQRYLAIFNQGE